MTQPTPIAVAVVEHAGRFLVGQRPAGTPLAGYWEFPGGKVQAGETAAEAAARECREETGLEIEVLGPYPTVDHRYAHDRVQLHFFSCRPRNPQQAAGLRFRWVERAALRSLRFPPANAGLIASLVEGPSHDSR